jgi:dienelactone hydrolase
MDFLSDTVTDGVRERRFVLSDVPGVLFSPSPGGFSGPLVLLAHGGGQHAAHPAVLSRARRYAGSCGFTVVALDAPGHGGRPRSAQLAASLAALPAAMAGGTPAAAVARLNAEIAAEAVQEWRVVLDALANDGHAPASVGFVGFSLGAAIGVPLIAGEPRIISAVLGLVGQHGLADDAARITVPVQLVVQWDDELVARDDALALFAAFGSSEKRLHVNPGGHAHVPAFERESAEHFLADHLGDREVAAVPHGTGSASRTAGDQGRLRRGLVLRSEEDACEVLVEGRPTWARYAGAFPTPRVARVSPGHLVALATAADATPVVVFRWYDAVVLGAAGDQVRMWEPAHGEVLGTPRHFQQRRQPGTRAYLSAGLPGANWWVAGYAATAAEQADVELGEVERFCTEHDLWDQLS